MKNKIKIFFITNFIIQFFFRDYKNKINLGCRINVVRENKIFSSTSNAILLNMVIKKKKNFFLTTANCLKTNG